MCIRCSLQSRTLAAQSNAVAKVRIIQGDCRETLAVLEPESVQCVVTSPPYFGLRDYKVKGQIGREPTLQRFLEEMVQVFREVRRVLRKDGTLWLNMGDTYNSDTNAERKDSPGSDVAGWNNRKETGCARIKIPGLKPKDLAGIPWRLALALQADGWWLRRDIIWYKPNPMPEGVMDRPTTAHEYIFLLTKRARYYYDAEAIKEPVTGGTHAKLSKADAARIQKRRGEGAGPGASNPELFGVTPKARPEEFGSRANSSIKRATVLPVDDRNKRSVWTVQTCAYQDAHFATYPPDLIKPCILAGSRSGDTVLDPFFGAGTTGVVCLELARNCIGLELNPEYCKLAQERCNNVTPGFAL
jgi:DNA modification methylase